MIDLDIIDIPILALLAATAVTVAWIRNLWAAVMFTGIYSFLGASWMLILDAPDVAFTEAAVGAGIFAKDRRCRWHCYFVCRAQRLLQRGL